MAIKSQELKRIREEKGWSIRELAKESKVSFSYISDLENGQKTNPTINTLCKLVKALGVKLEDLYSCN